TWARSMPKPPNRTKNQACRRKPSSRATPARCLRAPPTSKSFRRKGSDLPKAKQAHSWSRPPDHSGRAALETDSGRPQAVVGGERSKAVAAVRPPFERGSSMDASFTDTESRNLLEASRRLLPRAIVLNTREQVLEALELGLERAKIFGRVIINSWTS